MSNRIYYNILIYYNYSRSWNYTLAWIFHHSDFHVFRITPASRGRAHEHITEKTVTSVTISSLQFTYKPMIH